MIIPVVLEGVALGLTILSNRFSLWSILYYVDTVMCGFLGVVLMALLMGVPPPIGQPFIDIGFSTGSLAWIAYQIGKRAGGYVG